MSRLRPPTHFIGKRFNRLVVTGIEPARLPSGKSCYRASVRCDCGTEKTIYVTALYQNHTGSCGCDKSRYLKVGYVPGNVQWVHKRVNIMRNSLDAAEFIEWCRAVTTHASRVSIREAS